MSGRQIFSENEKVCLQELILKYNLNSAATMGAGNYDGRKTAWQRLTQEFNSIEINTRRTKDQLKKLWDNMKTRRKRVLAMEKRERMRTGGGSCVPGTSQGSQDIDGALLDSTNIELQYVCDSDFVDMSQEEATAIASASATSDGGEPSQIPDLHVLPVLASAPDEEENEESPQRTVTGSRLSDYGAASQTQVPKNVRAHVINEEFFLRKDRYRIGHQRDEELHKLKMAEREWLAKAAEENYKKACIERESAEELLKCNRAKRELAELKLNRELNINSN